MTKTTFRSLPACLLLLCSGCGPGRNNLESNIAGDDPVKTSKKTIAPKKIEKLLHQIPKFFEIEDYQNFPTTLIRIVKPDGFLRAERFVGFLDQTQEASELINISPMPCPCSSSAWESCLTTKAFTS